MPSLYGKFDGCGKSGHMKRDCPMMKAQGRNAQVQESAPNTDAPKMIHFYALRFRGEKESLPMWSPVCYKSSLFRSMLY